MDFHGMKMNDLQNNEMSSLLEKETVTKTKISSEDSIEADGIKENQAVSRNAKKVSFREEIEVFEFTRSAKKRQRNNVRSRSKGSAPDLQQGGIALRRSKRFVSEEGITVVGSNGNVSNSTNVIVETENVCSSSVPRLWKRIGSRGSTQEDCKVRELIALEQFDDKDLSKKLSGNGLQFEKVRRRSMRLAARIAKSCEEEERLVDIDEKEDELVKNNVNEVSDFEVQETEESHMKGVQNDPTVEKVPKRSRRLVNDIDVQTNTQNQRRSMRLKASLLCSGEESTEERKAKQSKGFVAVDSQEGELVRNKRKDPLIDFKVQTIEQNHRMKVQDVTKVEKSPRRSKRHGKNVTLLMDTNVKAVKRDDLEIVKTPRQSRKLKKSVSELLVDGQAQKGDEQQKRAYGNDIEDKKFLKPLKCTALDMGYANANSLKRCLVSDNERDGASDNVKDKMQVRVRFTKNYSKNDSSKAAIVVEGNLVDKTNKILVKSSKRVTRKMKRDRSAGMDIETAPTQSNLTPKLLDEHPEFDQEEAGGANTEARGSSKKSKTMNQDCTKDRPQGIVEVSPSSSETIAAESDMIIENVLQLNTKLMEGEYEEKVERDIVLMAMIKEDKEEVSSLSAFFTKLSDMSIHEAEVFMGTTPPPTAVHLAVSNPEAELGVSTGHILVKDIASTIIGDEDIKTKEEIFISDPGSELKEHNFVAKIAEAEAILENSAACCNEIHSSTNDKKGSLEKEIEAANLHGNFSEYNTEDSSAERQADICKVGRISVGHYVNLETLDEVQDDNTEKSELSMPNESGCKIKALELTGWLSINKAVSSTLDESAVFTSTPERNLMLMEQLIENGKTNAAYPVTHHNDEAVECHCNDPSPRPNSKAQTKPNKQVIKASSKHN